MRLYCNCRLLISLSEVPPHPTSSAPRKPTPPIPGRGSAQARSGQARGAFSWVCAGIVEADGTTKLNSLFEGRSLHGH